MTFNKTLFITFICISFSVVSHGQEMGFEEYNPTSTLVTPQHIVTQAKYPFIDVHSHQNNMSASKLTTLVKEMDDLNEAIMVNLSGGSGDRLNTKLTTIKAHYKNRFVVFANVNFEGVGKPDWG